MWDEARARGWLDGAPFSPMALLMRSLTWRRARSVEWISPAPIPERYGVPWHAPHQCLEASLRLARAHPELRVAAGFAFRLEVPRGIPHIFCIDASTGRPVDAGVSAEAVDARDQDVGDAAAVEVVEHGQPELRASVSCHQIPKASRSPSTLTPTAR